MNSNKYLSLSGLSIFYSKFKEWINSTFATKDYVNNKIPSVTTEDVGKFLRVQADGTWAAEYIPNAEEASF